MLKEKYMLLWIQNSIYDLNFLLCSSKAKRPIRRQKLNWKCDQRNQKYMFLLLAETQVFFLSSVREALNAGICIYQFHKSQERNSPSSAWWRLRPMVKGVLLIRGAADADAVRDANTASPAYISENRGARLCTECSVCFKILQAVAQISSESL